MNKGNKARLCLVYVIDPYFCYWLASSLRTAPPLAPPRLGPRGRAQPIQGPVEFPARVSSAPDYSPAQERTQEGGRRQPWLTSPASPSGFWNWPKQCILNLQNQAKEHQSHHAGQCPAHSRFLINTYGMAVR